MNDVIEDLIDEFRKTQRERFKTDIEREGEAEWENDALICPFCWHEHIEIADMQFTDEYGETECEECGKTFWSKHKIKRSIWSAIQKEE